MKEPAIGERCLVRPMPNLRVQEHGNIAGRCMADAWTERIWDEWLHKRFSSGEIMVKPLSTDGTAPAPVIYVAPESSASKAEATLPAPEKE